MKNRIRTDVPENFLRTRDQRSSPSGQKYEAFFSYNRQEPLVRNLYLELTTAGVRTFLDEVDLPRGEDWRPAITEAIRNSHSVAVFIGTKGLGNIQSTEIELALNHRDSLRQAKLRFPVFAVLLPGASDEQVPPWIATASWVDLRTCSPIERAERLAAAIRSQPVPMERKRSLSEHRARWAAVVFLLVLIAGGLYLGLIFQSRETVWTGTVNVQWWNPARWDHPAHWGGNAGIQSLIATSAQPGLLNLPGGEVFGDFRAEMTLIVHRGQKSIGWVVRARDSRTYYLFRYTFPNQSQPGSFQGILVRNGILAREPWFYVKLGHGPLKEGHRVYVVSAIKGRNAENHITYSCPPQIASCSGPDPDDGQDQLTNPNTSLDPRGPKTGRFGIISSGDDDSMDVRRLELTGLSER